MTTRVRTLSREGGQECTDLLEECVEGHGLELRLHTARVETPQDRTIIELICDDYLQGHPAAADVLRQL